MNIKAKLLIALFLVSYSIYGQDSTKTKIDLHHYFGVGAGFTTGYGLSYRLLAGKSGVQINCGPYISDKLTLISIGATMLYKIMEVDMNNIYLYYGNHLLYKKVTYEESWMNEPQYAQKTYVWNTGLGLDLEFKLSKQLVLNIMWGVGAYNYFETKTLTGEVGLHYRFK